MAPIVTRPVIVVTEFCVAVLNVPVKVAPVLPMVAARTVVESMVPMYPLVVLILAPVKVAFRLPNAAAYTLLNVPYGEYKYPADGLNASVVLT